MISLNKVNASNVWELLELQVLPEQEDFVATNTESIVEAYTTLVAGGTALPLSLIHIYVGWCEPWLCSHGRCQRWSTPTCGNEF